MRSPARLDLALAALLTLTSACLFAAPEDPAALREIPAVEVPPARADVPYQRFIAFGDWGTGRDDQQQVADAMASRLRAEAARIPAGGGQPLDFLVTTGDNFYPRGVASVDDPKWRTHFEEVYDAPTLREAPVFPSLGNHDYQGSVQAQIDYSAKNPRWRMPARYYKVRRPLGEGRALDLFVLDTERLGWRSSDPQQLAWLEQELGASDAVWKVVVGHHPLYSHSKRPFNLTLIRRLEPLLVAHDVDLYVAGHDHVLDLIRPVRGVYHLTSGAGGGSGKAYPVRWDDQESFYAATGGGFAYLRASPHELVIELVRLDGKTQYAHVLYEGRAGPF